MPSPHTAKFNILKTFYLFERLTYYHLINKRNITNTKEKRLLAYHMDGLLKQGLVKPCNQTKSSIYDEKYRHTYFELTKAGARLLGLENYHCVNDFSVQIPSFPHQYGLRTAMISTYYAYREKYVITAHFNRKENKEEYGYEPDGVMRFYDETGKAQTRIFEHECSKSIKDIIKDIKARNTLLGDRKDVKFAYIINVDSAKNMVDPILMYDGFQKEQKTVEIFFKRLLDHPEIKKLPKHKFRFAILHKFPDFGHGAWFDPEGKQHKLIN